MNGEKTSENIRTTSTTKTETRKYVFSIWLFFRSPHLILLSASRCVQGRHGSSPFNTSCIWARACVCVYNINKQASWLWVLLMEAPYSQLFFFSVCVFWKCNVWTLNIDRTQTDEWEMRKKRERQVEEERMMDICWMLPRNSRCGAIYSRICL